MEIAAVTARVEVSTCTFERAGVTAVKIVEITQPTNSNEIKVIIAKGLEGADMVRAKVLVTRRGAKIPDFNTG